MAGRMFCRLEDASKSEKVVDEDVEVSVSVTWTGTTQLEKSVQTSQFVSPDFVQTSRFIGIFRDATATGTVSFAGQTLTLISSDDAFIGRVTTGDISVFFP